MSGNATWLELCMDTVEDGPRLGTFWAAVIGGRLEATTADPAGNVVVPGVEGGGIAICPVPEAKTVKHRVHLDVYTAAVTDLEALGATVIVSAEESGLAWTVMTDPEGGEFCAFVKPADSLPDYRLHGVGVDSAEPAVIAQWWADRFGCEVNDNDGAGWFTLDDVPGMPIATMDFAAVPEAKAVKNRVHWDVRGRRADFEAAGAVLLRPRAPSTGSGQATSTGSGQATSTGSGQAISWDVMADPEGNEFCVFDPR